MMPLHHAAIKKRHTASPLPNTNIPALAK
jgi:hypothetical protein